MDVATLSYPKRAERVEIPNTCAHRQCWRASELQLMFGEQRVHGSQVWVKGRRF